MLGVEAGGKQNTVLFFFHQLKPQKSGICKYLAHFSGTYEWKSVQPIRLRRHSNSKQSPSIL